MKNGAPGSKDDFESFSYGDERRATTAVTEQAIEHFAEWLDEELEKLVARFPQVRTVGDNRARRRRPK